MQGAPSWVADWVRCEPYVAAALEYAEDTHTLEDVFMSVLAGHRQFWPGERSAIVTEVQQFPQKKVMHFFLAGGELEELNQMQRAIEPWAREQGCKSITLAGRRGWLRSFLREEGYQPKWTIMSKEL